MKLKLFMPMILMTCFSMQAMAENFADIYIKSISKVRIKDEYPLFENGYKKWVSVPESVKNKKMICVVSDADWTGKRLSIEVKAAGYVFIIIDSQLAKKFEGWVKSDSGKYLESDGQSERTAVVMKKHFEPGEHFLPLGEKWFPLIVVYM